ncbi:head maturation protease, ClpP-related [Mycolicibacterium psychrotolerans]|uniref:head maturation protease, ClpP-related n=1 Tax=Mycolicibacterium psychrotolerans TaxID=216929 RepID=UPI003D66DCDF
MRDWFRFVAAKAGKPAEVYVYGDIGETMWSDGVSAQSFVDELNTIDAAELHVRINSPGGSAWDGLTIANAIMRHPAKTTTFIDGLAASAASVVALAGDEVVVSKWGRAMLHNAHAMVMGTAADMREVATQLDALNANMASYYADRSTSGDDAAAFARAMEKETWYSAQELLDAGLATRIDDSGVRDEVEKAVASALATTRMKFQHPPTATMKETRMATKDDLAKRLGKDPADITDEDLMQAALDALGEADDKPEAKPGDPAPADTGAGADDPAPAPTPQAAPTPVPAAAKATVEVDSEAFAALQRQAQLGAQAFADAQAKADMAVVDKAIDEGRVPLARKNAYLALMKADRADTVDMLTNRIPPNTVPLSEIGHAADVPGADAKASATDNPMFNTWLEGLA